MEKLIKLVREGYDRDKLVNKMMKPIKDKEALKGKDTKKEASGDKEEYQKFFKAAMKKFGVKSPSELKGDKEKEFYDYIDKNWKGDHEESVELALEFGTPNMSAADKANLRRRIKDMQKSKKKESVTEAIKVGPNDNIDRLLSKDAMNQMAITGYLNKIFKIGPNDFNNRIYFDGGDLVSGSKTVSYDVIGDKRLKVSDLIKTLTGFLGKKPIKESVNEAYLIKHAKKADSKWYGVTGYVSKVGKNNNLMFDPDKKNAVKYKDKKSADDAMAAMIKDYAPYKGTISVVKESHVGTNGQSLEADQQGRGLSPKAQFVKSMMNPEVAADANKTALQTFAEIMNSVSAKGAPRSGDNTEQDEK